ncbi:hypothetical protein [Nostoc sp.]
MPTVVTERLVSALVLSAAEVVEPCRSPTGKQVTRSVSKRSAGYAYALQ